MCVASQLTDLGHARPVPIGVLNLVLQVSVLCMQVRVAVGCEFRWKGMVLPEAVQ